MRNEKRAMEAAVSMLALAGVIGWGCATPVLAAPTSAGILTGANATAPNTLAVRVPRGGQVTLPLAGVTRVLPEDVDVARASFINGRAVIQGVTTGTTLVEVYQGNQRQLLAVQVTEPIGANVVADSANISTVVAASNTSAVVTTPDGNTSAIVPAPALPAGVTVLPAGTASNPIVLDPAVAGAPSGGAGISGGAAITPAAPNRLPLGVSVRVAPVEDNPLQALVTLTPSNSGEAAQAVTIRYALDDLVSYVTGSATGNPRYDAAARELVWGISNLSGGESGQPLSFRVEPVDRNPVTFFAAATIEGADGVPTASKSLKYSFTTTPLLTVFALPDRFLAGRNAPVLVDVRGNEFQTAVDRLQKIGILNGRAPGLFYPAAPTQRAEYAVMTLKGLNLRDLRDLTAIKFVLGRRSNVSLNILNSKNQVVAALIKNQPFDAGEHTLPWDGRSGSGYAAPGRYTYVCTAKDARGETTRLFGFITIVPQSPIEPSGQTTFRDVKPSAWFSGYLAIAEKQDLIKGYPGRLFRPYRAVSRVEATAVVVRALGLEDLARSVANKDVGFLDYQDIPNWAVGYVNVASTIAKSANGKLIVGYPSNFFLPNKALRRDEAALIVQRLIDKETNRRVSVSGQLAPGAIVTINQRTVEAQDDGQFSFTIDQNTAEPVTVAVIDARR